MKRELETIFSHESPQHWSPWNISLYFDYLFWGWTFLPQPKDKVKFFLTRVTIRKWRFTSVLGPTLELLLFLAFVGKYFLQLVKIQCFLKFAFSLIPPSFKAAETDSIPTALIPLVADDSLAAIRLQSNVARSLLLDDRESPLYLLRGSNKFL